jgi:aspartate-semialdehyde dehydrogenase
MKAERAGTVAIVGAASLDGRELASRLAKMGLKREDILAFGPRLGPWELSLQDEAAEVLLPLEHDLLQRAEVLFMITADEKARETLNVWAREMEILVVDMCPPAGTVAHWPDPYGETSLSLGRWGHVTLPEPECLFMAHILRGLPKGSVEGVDCHLFLPASTRGEEGVQELFQQSVNLLSFKPIPTEVFGRQLAFDLVPEPERSGAGDFARQTTALLGADLEISLAVIRAPVYHSTVLSAMVRVRGGDRASETLLAGLKAGHLFKLSKADAWASPSQVPGEVKPALGLKVLSESLLWVWLAYDNVKSGKAALAERLYRGLRGESSNQ